MVANRKREIVTSTTFLIFTTAFWFLGLFFRWIHLVMAAVFVFLVGLFPFWIVFEEVLSERAGELK